MREISSRKGASEGKVRRRLRVEVELLPQSIKIRLSQGRCIRFVGGFANRIQKPRREKRANAGQQDFKRGGGGAGGRMGFGIHFRLRGTSVIEKENFNP